MSTTQALCNLLKQTQLADQARLDRYGVGEHHTATMPVSPPTVVINAAAALASQLTPSVAVPVLSTDDPVRL